MLFRSYSPREPVPLGDPRLVCTLGLAERLRRCDVIADTDPPICQHCKQYGFDCTFFLPITETRFKKKRLEEEAERERERDKERSTSSPHTDGARGADVRVFGKPPCPARTLSGLMTTQAPRPPRTCCTRKP